MKHAKHILTRSIDNMKSEAIKIDLEIEALKKELSEKERSVKNVMESINELQQAILKLEKPDVTNENSNTSHASKSKKTKR